MELAKQSKKKSSSVLGKIGGVVGFLIGFAIVGALLHHGSNSPSNSTALTTSTSWRTYTSTQDGFSIQFPGNPTPSNSSISVQGVSVPYDSYERDNNSSYWAVEVFKYTSQFDMSDVNARLEGALNGSVENTKGATLTSSSYTRMAGHTAITGLLSVSQSNQTINEYITDFLNGNTMYSFIGSGATQSNFNQFTGSFQFTQ